MKIRSVRAELFHTERRTDGWKDRHDTPDVRFSNFCESA